MVCFIPSLLCFVSGNLFLRWQRLTFLFLLTLISSSLPNNEHTDRYHGDKPDIKRGCFLLENIQQAFVWYQHFSFKCCSFDIHRFVECWQSLDVKTRTRCLHYKSLLCIFPMSGVLSEGDIWRVRFLDRLFYVLMFKMSQKSALPFWLPVGVRNPSAPYVGVCLSTGKASMLRSLGCRWVVKNK